MQFLRPAKFAVLLVLLGLVLSQGKAQTITTGQVVGTVTDPTGAVVPDAQVTLKSTAKGIEVTAKTSSTGTYLFSLVSPGHYTLVVSAPNFKAISREIDVALGSVATIDVRLAVGTTTEVIEVTAAPTLVQTDSPNVAATITAQQVSELPNPGNDLSYIAQTAPGSVMNTQAGFGNFSSYGMPGTSNLFTLNGMDDNDPFLNLNNSGATNLLLGQNEVEEVSVVNIGYGAQYGGLAGANVNYITKSGSNAFHGQATYFWNGSRMNANDWFNNQSGTKKPFSNANQWGAWFGGPLKKDKLFFFLNTEGLRVVIPTNSLVLIPSPQFETATIANLTANGLTASIPFYQNAFNLYNTAAGAANATPGNGAGDPLGCNGFTGLAAGVPCALNFRSTAGNFTHEWIFSSRVDYNFSNHDQFFVRYQMDRGVQATYTDPINPAFNASSYQPEYQGQMSETHAFGSGATNQFILSGAWYQALFGPPNLAGALAKFPTTLEFNDGTFTDMGGLLFIWPQGRDVTQYQVSDDYTKIFGRHAFKTGIKFRRNDISDHDYGLFNSGLLIPFTVTDFFNGGSTGSILLQNFPTSLDQPIAIYSLGGYAQDDFKIRSNLTLTLSLRIDHPSNPICNKNCFARLTGPFSSINHDPTIPYNQVILTNQHQALSGLDSVLWQPRFGFAWQPFGSRKNQTVVRGGIGIFYDAFPGQIADNLSSNPPLLNAFTTFFDNLSPDESTNLFSDASQSNQAFINGFSSGQTLAQIQAAAPAFVPPNLTVSDKKTHAPQYQKWSFEIQQGFGNTDTVTVSYVGNHGIHEAVLNNGVNAFSSSFTGLPTSPADARFGTVTVAESAGVSNYNGVTVSYQHRVNRFGSGMFQANYTYGHALDMVSNAGFNEFTTGSSENPTNPFNIRTSYGNADYDVRHSANMNYIWGLPIRSMLFGHGWARVVEGWQVSGTLFVRSGLPYTVFDANATSLISSNNYGGSVYASFLGGAKPACSNPNDTCVKASMFAPTGQNSFGNQERNNFRGPGFIDTDFTVMKSTKLSESTRLSIGLQFFNILNHPNFNLPDHDLAHSTFGKIESTVGPPTSILGSFLGGDASPRIIQLKAQFTF